MARVTFENGVSVSFQGTPSPQDVEEVAQHLAISKPAPTPEAAPSVGGFIGNVASSAGNLIGNTVNAIVHPIDTISNLAGTVAGAGEELANTVAGTHFDTPDTQKWDAVKNFFGQRYGSPDAFLHTLYKDPVGVAADASAVLGLGGAALRAGGRLGEVSELSKAGQIAGAAGEAVNPFNAVSAGVRGATNLGNAALTKTLGFTTRAGTEAAQSALRGESDFTAAMRGSITPEDVVSTAKKGLQTIKTEQKANYQTALEGIKGNTLYGDTSGYLPGNIPAPIGDSLDLAPIQTSLTDSLRKFNINPLDVDPFARSTISKAAQRAVQEAIDLMNEWGTKPGDRTPVGLDLLKRKLQDIERTTIRSTGSTEATAFITPLRQSVGDLLKTQVPGYEEMVSAYAKTSELLKEMKQLSLGGQAGPQTILNKIMKAATTDEDFRRNLLEALKRTTGKDIQQMAQGLKFRQLEPRGLLATGEFIGGFFHPQVFGALLASSPRVAGEFLRTVGMSQRGAAQFMKAIHATQAALIASEANKATQMPAQPSRSQVQIPPQPTRRVLRPTPQIPR